MTKVTDASRRIKFKITTRDVVRGKPKNTRACAAALALKRTLHADAVDVRLTRTFVEKNGKTTRYQTPPALRFEAATFDRGGKFEAGDYEIRPIPPSQTAQGAARAKKKREITGRKRPFSTRRQTPNVRASARGVHR